MYKEIESNDIYEILKDCLSSDLQSYDLADLIYDFLNECYEEIEETTIYDFVRFEMQVQTLEEIKENYNNMMEDKEDKEDKEDEEDEEDEEIDHDFIENFLSYNTLYLGSYEEENKIYYVFSDF
jgi:myo-inositol-1-phosphate synthase